MRDRESEKKEKGTKRSRERGREGGRGGKEGEKVRGRICIRKGEKRLNEKECKREK